VGSGSHGHALEADGGESLSFGGATVLIKAASDTVSVWEEPPPLLDTPLHIHEHEDEYFQILAGEHVFQCGDDEFEVAPGGFVFLPRGVPHAHRRVVKEKDGSS
jgi:mannose-6-phosphate isomerase-like protein (cupin superfamily)